MDKPGTRSLARLPRMARRWLIGALGLALIAYGPSAVAAPNQVLITEVFVDSPAVDQMTIKGQNFDGGSGPVVTLGDLPTQLVVMNVAANEIVVQLPVGLVVGDYLLTVSTGGLPARAAAWS